MSQKIMIGGASLALLFALSACEEEAPPEVLTGDLQVTYVIGSGTSNCEDLEIAFVRVYVTVAGEETAAFDEISPCDPDAQVVTFNDLEVGDYTVRIEGLDGDNNVIYNGEYSNAVTVEADQTNGPFRVTLSQILPSLEIYFDFDEVGNCGSLGVADIVVRLFRDGVSPVHDEIYECEAQINEALVIPDLNDSSTYDLQVRGHNENNEPIYRYDYPGISVTPGPPLLIDAEMTSCPTTCED